MSTQTTEIFSLPVGAISGSTPFGYYDSDSQFQTDGPKFCNLSARKLGYPVVDVELPSGSMFAAFEDAVTEYSLYINQNNAQNNFLDLKGTSTTADATGKNVSSNFLNYVITLSEQYGSEIGAGGNITWHSGSIMTTASVQDYDLKALIEDQELNGSEIVIKKVYHKRVPASARYYDPAVGLRQAVESFGATSGVYNYLLYPIYDDLLKIQEIEFNDTVRKSFYSFRIINNVLRLYPAPDSEFSVHFEYILKADRTSSAGIISGSGSTVSDISNVPYSNLTYANINSIGKKWIFNYGFALVQEMLGRVRSKYQSIPGANGDISLDGQDLISKGQDDQEKLKTELKETLEKMTTTALLTEKQQQSEIVTEELSKMPLPIYIR